MSRVAVEPTLLEWALARSGLTPKDLQDDFPHIIQWLAGESYPTLRQLESLARATHTPLGYLLLKEPPEETFPVPYFRTQGDERVSKPSPDLLETIQTMQRRQVWMREFLLDEGQERLSFVGTTQREEDSALIARRIRREMGLNHGWADQQATWEDALRMLRESVEALGVLVFFNGVVGNNTHRKLDPAEFRGFVLVDDYAPLLFVNAADAKAAQMFTLAHELAHLFFGSSAAFDLREMRPSDNPTERACNRVAAEFLVPEDELLEAWSDVSRHHDPFRALARRFKVSVLVAARRALDLKLVTKDSFLEFYYEYQREEHRRGAGREGGDFYLTQNLRVGHRFASAVLRAVKERKLLYSEAYRLTGLYGKTFHEYAASIGGGGA